MYDIYDILLALPVLLLLWYWWRSSGQHAIALRVARAYCKERQLQILDDTLSFKRWRIERGQHHPPRLCRLYEFDYSRIGEDRHSGELILCGNRVLRVILSSEVLEITEYEGG